MELWLMAAGFTILTLAIIFNDRFYINRLKAQTEINRQLLALIEKLEKLTKNDLVILEKRILNKINGSNDA